MQDFSAAVFLEATGRRCSLYDHDRNCVQFRFRFSRSVLLSWWSSTNRLLRILLVLRVSSGPPGLLWSLSL